MQKICPVDVIDGAVRRINALGWLFLGVVNLSLAWLFHHAFAHFGLFVDNHRLVANPHRTAPRQQSVFHRATHGMVKVAKLEGFVLHDPFQHCGCQPTYGVLIHVSAGNFGLGLFAVQRGEQHLDV